MTEVGLDPFHRPPAPKVKRCTACKEKVAPHCSTPYCDWWVCKACDFIWSERHNRSIRPSRPLAE